jgi:hypothetical protein
MKKLYISALNCKKLPAILFIFFISFQLSAQTITNYTFAASSGTFTALTSPTNPTLSGGNVDDGYFNNIPIGFDFWYMGVRYTTVSASTNGWLILGAGISDAAYLNNLSGGTSRPVIAPLWDDLDVQVATNVSYKVTGSAPTRVFTIQYLNAQWQYNATGNTISFQVRLYEGTGKVEFIYRPETGTLATPTASIGITAAATGSGNFLSVNNAGTSASSTVEASVTTKPVSGKTYAFTPPAPTAPGSLTFSSIGTTSMTLNWTDLSSNETGFVVYKSTDGGTTYNFENQTAAGAISSVQSGLTTNTTYYWKIYAVSEGGLSTALSGNQATTVLLLSDWLYRKAITIDYTKAGAGPHTNFPVLINMADADLQTKAQTDADDILFTSADGTTKLDHQIESYTSATGTIVAWVEIPSLSSAANTVIYMYYGNAAATSQQNVTGTWNTNFKGVWHMNTVFTDATSNANNGTNTGTIAATGKISGGRGFVRSDGADYITVSGQMGSPTSFTLSAWANITTADVNAADIISIADNGVLRYDVSNSKVNGVCYDGTSWNTTLSSTNYASGWHYVVYTFDDAGNTQRIYVDGQPDGSATTFTTSPNYTGGTNTLIGMHGTGNTNMDFDGTIDEARVSNASRSAGWVLTEYNNQNSPSTFYSVGTETVTKAFTGTGNFSTAARWTGGTLPIAGENIVIDGACTIDNNVGTDSVAYGTLIIGTATGRTLNWAASGTNRLNVSNVSAAAGASTLDMTNGGTLIIRGTWTATNLTFTPGTGTIETQATITLPAAYTTYNNLTLNNAAATFTAAVNTTVNGILSITGTLQLAGFSLTVGRLQGEGTLTSSSGTPTLTTGSSNTSTTFSGIIGTGAIALTKNGTGTLTLSGSNTYTGLTTIAAGTLQLGSTNALGTTTGATSVTSGAVLDLNGINYSNAEALTLSGTGISTGGALINSNATAATYAGNITLSTTAPQITASNPITLSGIISGGNASGTNSLTVAGNSTLTGALTLSGNNTYTGYTTINSGALLKIGANNALGAAAPNGATDAGDGNSTIINWGGVLDLNGITYTQFEGVRMNGAGFSAAGDGCIINSSPTPAIYRGCVDPWTPSTLYIANPVTFNGMVQFRYNNSFTKTGSSTLTLSPTGGDRTTANSILIISAGTLKLGANFTETGSTTAYTRISSGAVLDLNGFTCARYLYINGTGISSGGALINSSSTAATHSGFVILESASSIVAGTGTIAITGTVTGAGFGLTLGGAAGGSVTNIIAGTLTTVTKADVGAWTLSGANTFTGGTTLGAGQLNINHATAIGSGTFTITGGIINNTTAGSITLSNNNLQNWNGDFTFTGTQALNMGTGAVTLSASRQITVSASTLTVGGIINQSTLNLTKAGSGTLTFGNQTITLNNLTISAGTLTATSGSLNVAGNFSNSGTFTHNSGTVTFNGATVISGTTTTNTFNHFTVAASSTVTSSTGITGLVVNGTLTTGASAILDLGTTTVLSGTLGTISNSGTIKTSVPTSTSALPIPTGKTWGGTVEYAATSGAQTAVSGTYNNINFSNTSGTTTAGGNITVSNQFGTTAGGTIDMGSTYRLITMGGTVTNNGTVKTFVVTTTSAVPFPANTTWGGSGTVEYAATTGAQTILFGTYKSLKLSNTSGTNTITGNVTINGTFTLSGGTATTGSYLISITSTGSVSRTGGHVIGNFKKYVATGATSKTFEIGDATNYTPVTVAFANVTTADYLTASSVAGDHANIATSTFNASYTANRNWTLTNQSIVFTTYDATFTFVAGDLDAGTTTGNFIVGLYNAGWTYPTVGTKTATSTQATGITTFGNFQLGEMTLHIFTGTGNFSDAARWTGGTLPVAGNNLLIDGACTVDNSVTTDNIAYGTLTIGTATGRTLGWAASGTNRLNVTNVSAGAGASILSMTNGGTVIIRGTWTSTNLSFTSGTGTIEIQSTITLPAAYASYYNLTINGSGIIAGLATTTAVLGNVTITAGALNANNFNLSVKANWTNNTSTTAFTAGTATVTFNATTAQAIGGSFATTFNDLTLANTVSTVTLNINTSISGNLSISSGTFDLAGFTANRASAGGTLTVSNNATLKIGGTNTYPTNYATNTLVVASTVEYAGTDQTVANQTYGNLTLSSSSGNAIKTFPGTALAVVGNLTSTVGAGTSVSFTAASNITVSGNISIGASTTFNSDSYLHSISGNWVNGGTFNGNTGTVSFTGSGKGVSGSGAQNFNNLTVAASGVTFSAISITLTGNLATTGSGSFSQASGGTFLMTGSGKTIGGSGISLDNLTVNGSVSTATSLTITGNLSVSGSFTASAGSVTMSGASKTMSGAGAGSFNVLSVSGSVTTAANFSISSGLIVSGSLSASAGTATFTGTATLSGTANLFNTTINGTSLQLSTNSILGVANALTIAAGTLDVTSSTPNTVRFNGTGAQNINAITYGNLVLSNGNTKTAAGAITTNYDITIETGTTFNPSSYTHSLYGSWINNGNFTPGTSTVQFLGPASSSISGVTTFNILTSNTSSSTTTTVLQSNISAAIVNMTNGVISTGTNTLTITGTRTGNGIIIGNIQRTHAFTTGVAYAFEGPDNTISFSAVSLVTSVTVSVVKGSVGDFPFGGSIGREYAIAVPAGTYTAILRLHYEDGELNGSVESSMGLWNYNGSAWTAIGKTANSTTSNYVEYSGLTNITNRWTCSDNSNVVQWNGSVSTDWHTAANWSVLQGSASMPPLATDIVNLGNAAFTHQPTINSAVSVKNIIFGTVQAITLSMASGGSLTSGDINGTWSSNITHTINANDQSININGDLVLGDGINGHAIDFNMGSGVVTIAGSLIQTGGANINFSGAGTLHIADDFNSVSGTFTAGSGTVIYDGLENQHMAHLNYNNLTINKTTGIAEIDSTVIIAGNLLISSGQLDNASACSIAGNVTIASGASLHNSDSLYIGGNWINNGNYIAQGAHIVFNGSGTQTITASTFNNFIINKPVGSSAILTGNVVVNDDLTITSGTFDIKTFNCNRSTLGGTATLADSGTFIVGGNNIPANFSSISLANSSTVILDGTGAQSIFGVSFGNLIFRNAGLKTLISPVTVNGNLTIESGATFNGSSQTITLNGNWIDNGTFTPSTSTVICAGTLKTLTGNTTFNAVTVTGSYTILNNVTFNSLLNITSNGSISGGGSILTTLHGDLINSGILYTLGTTTFSGNVLQTLSLINAVQTVALIVSFNGSVSPVLNSTSVPQYGYININNTGGVNPSVGWTILYSLAVGSGASFNGGNSTHNILGSVTNNGAMTSSGAINFIPSSTVTVNLGNNFSSTGTVNFGGAGAMTVAGTAASFYNVIVSNTNVAGITSSTDWNMANNFTVNSGAKLNAGSRSYAVGHNLLNNGTISSGTSTFTMNGTTAQSVGGSLTPTFNHLIIANTGDTVTAGVNASVAGNLSVTNGTFNLGSFTANRLTAGGTLTVSNGAGLKIGSTNTLPSDYTTHSIGATSTIEYNGTGQSVAVLNSAQNYGHLVVSGSGTEIVSGNVSVTNNLSITAGSLNINTNTLKIGGTITNSGLFTASNGTIEMNGIVPQTIPAATFSGNMIRGLTVNNTAGVTLGGALSLTDVLTVSNGSLAAGGYLTLKSTDTTTARVAAITSVAATPVSGHVITERYVAGRRKYRLITSTVTTSTSSTLTAEQEALSIWGNWQNGGINTTPNVGNLITGGSTTDGFDAGTTNASLFTYNDVSRSYVGYTTANGKNTKYTPLKAGVAYLMFVYGDRLNSVFATSPHNTVLVSTGTLLTGDQAYNTGSAIPLSGVTGRFTLLGNPFASPINWATIPKTNLDNAYWGWDPNLSSTGGYITVTTLGAVTLQAPYSGSTGLNQYIQSGQGFFVKTSGASPVLTIREQDKVSNFNGNAFRVSTSASDISLLAINLQYVSSGNKILADGVLAAFDPAFSNQAGVEDASKMANSGESIAILNDTTSLSIDARQMPQNNDTLFLNVSRLTKPQYTLQIFAQQMEGSTVTAYLNDRYLNTLQPLSLRDTNNIVVNVSAAIPASADINRFQIIFNAPVVILPVTFTSIKATQKNKDIQVDWDVAEESHIRKYEIEKSAESIHFYKVGEVPVSGNNSIGSYHWLDENPVTGNNYYRIRAIQTDGKSFVSKTVVVKMTARNAALKVFPNPVINKRINITSNEMAKGKYTVLLHNPQGREVIRLGIDHPGGSFNKIIYCSSMLPSGIYYLHLANEKDEYEQVIFIE